MHSFPEAVSKVVNRHCEEGTTEAIYFILIDEFTQIASLCSQ